MLCTNMRNPLLTSKGFFVYGEKWCRLLAFSLALYTDL